MDADRRKAVRRRLEAAHQDLSFALDDFDAGRWEDVEGFVEEAMEFAAVVLREMERVQAAGTGGTR